MKQLYYTSCVAGRSVNGQSGFQVRAASAGITPDRLRALLRYVNYALPPGCDSDMTTSEAPRRLSLLTTDSGRLLCHACHAGRDPTTNRAGNFFAHLLIDVPAEIDAGKAAAMWKASFWRQSDGEGPADLPDLDALAPIASPSAAELATYSQSQASVIRFLLIGVLTAPVGQQLFVVAPPEGICRAVMCLARMLPRSLSSQLTFSTYECEPLSCSAKIVGTWMTDKALDMPSACYSGSGLGFNSLTNKASPLPSAPAFAEFALNAIAGGREKDLVAFFGECSDVPLLEPATLDLAYRVLRSPAEMSRADFEQVAPLATLASRACSQSGAPARLTRWAIEEPAFRELHYARLVRAAAGGIGPFLQATLQEGLNALNKDDVPRARTALEVLPQIVNPGQQQSLGDALARSLDVTKLPRGSFSYALPHVLQSSAGTDPRVRDRWLSVNPVYLPDVLDLPIAEDAKLWACQRCLTSSQPSAQGVVIETVKARPDLAFALFERLAADSGAEESAVVIFRALLESATLSASKQGLLGRFLSRIKEHAGSGYAPRATRELLERTRALHAARRLSTRLLDHCLTEIFRTADLSPQAFLAAGGKWVLAALPDGQSPARLAERLLSDTQHEILTQESIREFLRLLEPHASARRLSSQHYHLVHNLVTLADFLTHPALDEKSLQAASAGVQSVPSSQERSSLVRQAVQLIADVLIRDKGGDAKRRLELVLLHFAPMAVRQRGGLATLLSTEDGTGEWTDLFRQLLDCFEQGPGIHGNSELIYAVATVGLGGPIDEPRLAARPLSPRAKASVAQYTISFLQRVTVHCDRRSIAALDAHIRQQWPPSCRDALGRWVEASRAPPIARRHESPWWLWLLPVVALIALAFWLKPDLLKSIFHWLLD